MERSRDLKEELNGLMRDLTFCLQRTLPSKQFQAQLMLGTVALGLILKQLLHARDPTGQEMLQQEFERGLKTVRHGIALSGEPAGSATPRLRSRVPKDSHNYRGLFTLLTR